MGKNCGFFNKSIFLSKSTLAFATLYYSLKQFWLRKIFCQIWTLNILLWLRPLYYKLMPVVLQVNNWHPNTLLNAKYNDTDCSCIIHEKWQIWISLSQRWGSVTMQSTPQMARIECCERKTERGPASSNIWNLSLIDWFSI